MTKLALAILVIFFWAGFQSDALTVYANTTITTCPEICKEQEDRYENMERLLVAFPNAVWCDFYDCYWEGKNGIIN